MTSKLMMVLNNRMTNNSKADMMAGLDQLYDNPQVMEGLLLKLNKRMTVIVPANNLTSRMMMDMVNNSNNNNKVAMEDGLEILAVKVVTIHRHLHKELRSNPEVVTRSHQRPQLHPPEETMQLRHHLEAHQEATVGRRLLKELLRVAADMEAVPTLDASRAPGP